LPFLKATLFLRHIFVPKRNFFSNNIWYYSDLELDKDKYCDYGDLLYAWSASFGPKIWDGNKTIYHYHIWKVLIKENNNKSFIYHLLIRF